MISNSVVWIKESTKKKLDNAKLCADESYNSVIVRALKTLLNSNSNF